MSVLLSLDVSTHQGELTSSLCVCVCQSCAAGPSSYNNSSFPRLGCGNAPPMRNKNEQNALPALVCVRRRGGGFGTPRASAGRRFLRRGTPDDRA